MTDGCLSESDMTPGRRILDGKPGVYMMKDDRKEKAFYYARFVCLHGDGHWVRAMWHLQTDRGDAVRSGNDQWIGRQRSTHLVALYVQVVTVEAFDLGQDIQFDWDPALELKPTAQSTKGCGKGKTVPSPPPLPQDSDSADTDREDYRTEAEKEDDLFNGYSARMGARKAKKDKEVPSEPFVADMEVEGVSPDTNMDRESVPIGQTNQEYYLALLTMSEITDIPVM